MILIADNKPETIISLRGILEPNNFAIDTAGSGEEAVKKVLKNNYALIILDVETPGMDRVEVAEAIAGAGKAKGIPIIFLSAADTDKQFITRSSATGVIDYVTRPVDPDILLLKVRTFNELYEQKRELSEMQQTLQAEMDLRRQAQAELSSKVQEMQAMLEAMPQMAFTAKPNGSLEYVNGHWHTYSVSAEKFPELHPDDAPIWHDWPEALKQNKPFASELRLLNRQTNEYKYHLLRIVPVQQEGKVLKWLGTFSDIHQQKMANELLEQRVNERTKELQAFNTELEERNEELTKFAWVASHDLKEPLRKIQVFSFMLLDKSSREDVESARYIGRIIDSSDRMSRLINDLLNYSHLSNAVAYKPTDLNVVIQEIIADLEITIRDKDALISVAEMPVIDAIPAQMRQIFQNLLSNSIKFCKAGQRPQIAISAERIAEKELDAPVSDTGNYYRIQVRDNGIGFNEEHLDKIFTIFQRLHTRDEYAGNGIGLAITKRSIEKHKGLITARSKENEGTTFILILPATQSNLSATAAPDVFTETTSL